MQRQEALEGDSLHLKQSAQRRSQVRNANARAKRKHARVTPNKSLLSTLYTLFLLLAVFVVVNFIIVAK